MRPATDNQIVPQLITKGKVPRPGIGIVVLDEESAASLGVVGVVVERVASGSAADRAGLEGIDYRNQRLGDIIVAADNNDVKNIDEFIRILQDFRIGQRITLDVRRGSQTRRVQVEVMDIS